MCGIFGLLHLDMTTPADSSPLTAMGDCLRHRGPDAGGIHTDGPAALGHRRLSIIDLSENASQPMANEDRSVWITFNGEIYNYQDFMPALRSKGHTFRSQSDTEVILHLYEDFGIECLKQLKGMFAFALWDRRRGEFFLVRDRMGIKPLHYAQKNGVLCFASEIKALLQHPAVSRQIDYDALNQYLAFEYVPAPLCIFRDIRKVEPGHYLHVNRQGVRQIRYWSPESDEPPAQKSETEYAEELRGLLEQVVRRSLISDVPLGAFLSGGIDSGTLCAWMQKSAPGRIKTFSIGFDDASFDESRFARLTARHLGTEHYEETLSAQTLLERVPKVIDCLDEPLGDASLLPTLLLSEFARRHVTVALSGDGGDELFAGYPTYPAHAWAHRYAQIPKSLQTVLQKMAARIPVSHKNISLDFKIKKFLSAAGEASPAARHYRWLGSFAPEEMPGLLKPEIFSRIRLQNSFAPAEDYYASLSKGEMLEKILFCDQRFYLQDDMLVKVDRASMACSLEVRVPLLEQEIVEFAARLPLFYKLHGSQTKYLLKKIMRDFLPREIISRNKKGFGVPLAKWFCQELRPLLSEIFLSAENAAGSPFNRAAVSQLLEEHWTGRVDRRKKIYTLLNFELWRKKYRPVF